MKFSWTDGGSATSKFQINRGLLQKMTKQLVGILFKHRIPYFITTPPPFGRRLSTDHGVAVLQARVSVDLSSTPLPGTQFIVCLKCVPVTCVEILA